MGAEAIKEILQGLDLDKMSKELRERAEDCHRSKAGKSGKAPGGSGGLP